MVPDIRFRELVQGSWFMATGAKAGAPYSLELLGP